MENKYQEALDNICCGCYGGNEGCNGKDKFCLNYLTIKELVDKATPKKPITIKPEGTTIWDYPTDRIKCPSCNTQLPMKKNCLKKKVPITYCDRCGQKIDWSDDE